MIMNENFITALLENEDFAQELSKLFSRVHFEQINIQRKQNRNSKFFSDYNKVRNEMIHYLFTQNCKYHFMGYVPLYKYNYLVSEIETYVYGLRISDELSNMMNHYE